VDIELSHRIKKELTLAEARIISGWSLCSPAQMPPELTKRMGQIHALIKKLHDDITREEIKHFNPN